jgi:hypothetical protein
MLGDLEFINDLPELLEYPRPDLIQALAIVHATTPKRQSLEYRINGARRPVEWPAKAPEKPVACHQAAPIYTRCRANSRGLIRSE